jgi:hypothetical protein
MRRRHRRLLGRGAAASFWEDRWRGNIRSASLVRKVKTCWRKNAVQRMVLMRKRAIMALLFQAYLEFMDVSGRISVGV